MEISKPGGSCNSLRSSGLGAATSALTQTGRSRRRSAGAILMSRPLATADPRHTGAARYTSRNYRVPRARSRDRKGADGASEANLGRLSYGRGSVLAASTEAWSLLLIQPRAAKASLGYHEVNGEQNHVDQPGPGCSRNDGVRRSHRARAARGVAAPGGPDHCC